MSWQTYVDDNLVGSGKVTAAYIMSAAGDSVWATSPGLILSPSEQKEIVKAFYDPSTFQAEGIYIAGRRYVMVQNDAEEIRFESQKDGGMFAKTTQAVIVALYSAPIVAGELHEVVSSFAEYLISKPGY